MRGSSRMGAMLSMAALALSTGLGAIAGRSQPEYDPRTITASGLDRARRKQWRQAGGSRHKGGNTRHADPQRQASLRRRMGGNAMRRRQAAMGLIWDDGARQYIPGRDHLTEQLYPPHRKTLPCNASQSPAA